MVDIDAEKMTTEASQVAEKVAKDIGKQIREFYDQKKHSAIEMKEDYESLVRSRPISSVVVAFSVGLGIGYLLTKNK